MVAVQARPSKKETHHVPRYPRISFLLRATAAQLRGQVPKLNGHNGKAIITLAGPSLDALGMVMDSPDETRVAEVESMKRFDHKMLLHRDDPVLAHLKEKGEPVVVLDVNPTAENIAKMIYDYTKAQGFPVTEVTSGRRKAVSQRTRVARYN